MNLNSLNLDLAATDFSLRNAVALAQASAAAYGECQVSSDLCHVLLLPQVDESGKTSSIVVAFRGTHKLKDALTDAEIEREHLPHTAGSVHAGFWKSVGSIIEQLTEAVQVPGDMEDCPLFLTGHSKGGAEAMLAAYLLTSKVHPARIAGVYTFDQPRLFDRGGRMSYDAVLRAATWRIVNGGDIVPQVPFWHWGYRHAGQECFLPDCGVRNAECGILINPAWDITAAAKLGAYIRALQQHRDVLLADHFITDIQDRLEEEEAIRTRNAGRSSASSCGMRSENCNNEHSTPPERGVHAASASPGMAALKRAEARAPQEAGLARPLAPALSPDGGEGAPADTGTRVTRPSEADGAQRSARPTNPGASQVGTFNAQHSTPNTQEAGGALASAAGTVPASRPAENLN